MRTKKSGFVIATAEPPVQCECDIDCVSELRLIQDGDYDSLSYLDLKFSSSV